MKLSEKTKEISLAIIIILSITIVTIMVANIIIGELVAWSSDKYVRALMYKEDFTWEDNGGTLHPWYIAPMKGCMVQLYNGSSYTVNTDFWDACEHNPNQGHLIGIGYTNKTAYDERIILDQNVTTRNYTATWQTIAWVNATEVDTVIFQALNADIEEQKTRD